MHNSHRLLIGVALLTLSCTRSASPPPVTSTPGAAFDAAVGAIQAATANRAAAMQNAGIEAVLDTYLDDAVWLPSQSEEFVGKELARAKLKVFLDAFHVREAQQPDEHAMLAPDVVMERGNYAVELTPRLAGDPTTDAGTYMTIWRKTTGNQWKIAYQMWTSHRSLADVMSAGKGERQ